ncbi:CBS domain-containing protein [Lysobacter antibioticus]|uniref:CBS domain protein n=1 Tax=Lysobacter antibioticus TaxID=84531 RepID=A0A0S2FDB7_LYSAN|nr:CBS domain-containing protein [Lysobacter antibioticus]ALN81491.1 CBS domain protein [Lysobacter antibioticus]
MITAKTLMTPDPATCFIGTPAREIARLMLDNDCGEIPVLDERRRPLGVVTDRDIAIRIVATGGDGTATAGEAMTSPVKTVGEDSDLQACVALMETAQVRRVPVVNATGELVGIVSLADIALAGQSRATAAVVKEVSTPAAAH